jgi:predicted nucleic acid-binding Zn ribbon protein
MAGEKSQKGFEHIGDILRNTLEKWLNTTGEPITRIWEVWDAAVGSGIADNARPAYLKKNLLIVHVPSSVWIQQLQFSKRTIIDNINNALGDRLVSEIKFKIGP